MIQGSNALFPLVLFPYLFIIFDKEVFAQLVIIESIVLYLLAFSLYSFDVTGVKYVGQADKDLTEKCNIFYDILLIRLFIFIVLCLCCIIIVLFFYQEFLVSTLLWMLFPLGMILQCNYYHQAIEKNSILATIVFFCRSSAIVFAFILCKDNNDFNLVVLILGGNYLLSGVLSVVFLAKNFKIQWYQFSLQRLYLKLKDGFGIYLGNLSVALFRGSNVLLLSLVSTPAAIAVYALAEKFTKTTQALVRPLNQFAYPKVVKDVKDSEDLNEVFSIILARTTPQLLVLVGGLVLVLSVGMVLQIYELLPHDLDQAFLAFFVMSFATGFGVCNYMFGTVGMSLMNYGSYYAKAIFTVGVVSVFVTLILGYHFNEYGAAIAYTLSEVLLLVFFLIKFKSISSRV